MNRDAERQSRLRPKVAEWGALSSAQMKGEAQDFLGRVLDDFEHMGGEPDTWEAPDLMYACALVAAGAYTAAIHYTDRALTPVGKRGAENTNQEFLPSLGQLQGALHEVAALPVIDR